MKGKTVLNYHVETPSLKDALATAHDVYLSTGMKPDSIDLEDDETVVNFNERDALSVRRGDLGVTSYVLRHRCPPSRSMEEDET